MRHDDRRAAVVAIGDELLAGRHPDTNSGQIAQKLFELGITCDRFVVLGDDKAALERAFYELCADYQIVVATGGLGPTLDDVTREAAAAAAGVPLERDEATWEGLVERWRSRGREIPPTNARQALFPAGSQIMPNGAGTAPGFRVWIEGGMLAVLPGPPREMRAMLEGELLPWLARTCGRGEVFETASFHLFGLAESTFDELAGDWMHRDAQPRMGVTAHLGVLRVSLAAKAESAEGARRLIDGRAVSFRERFGEWIFSEDDPDLARVLVRELDRRGSSVATAESCTGGLVAERITSVPGASRVFSRGWVTYSNEAKTAELGVPTDLLDAHGAVSEEVARAMAEGARRAAGAEIAVSLTGIAGPDGGTPEKPVGLVWIAVSTARGTEVVRGLFPDIGRDAVRTFAATRALELVFRAAVQGGPAGD